MTRRSGTVPGLTVATAFERLVPVLERQTCLLCAEGDKHETDAARGGAKPMTDPIAKRYVTNSAMPRIGVRSR